MYVKREDEQKDVVQIGNHPHVKTRYISHLEQYGMAFWLHNEHIDVWRPSVYIYAKRDMNKHKEFAPPMKDEDVVKMLKDKIKGICQELGKKYIEINEYNHEEGEE